MPNCNLANLWTGGSLADDNCTGCVSMHVVQVSEP